jgi:hypothetical protein
VTPVGLGDSFYLHVGTSSATTGAATNADSTPTVTIEEDGVAMGYAPTVANVSTGLYRVTIDATAGNGFEAGKRYSAYVSATVGGINGKDGIGEFEVLGTDLNVGMTNLDATVSSRLATAGYTAPDNADIVAILGFVDTEIAAIKAKTDQLAFTVANQVDANVQAVNDTTVTGNGQPGTEWGPA